MGIQVTVLSNDLKQFETRTREVKVFSTCAEDCFCGGEGCSHNRDVFEVMIPGIGWVSSYHHSRLVFDNKSANQHIYDVLDGLKVPYTRS